MKTSKQENTALLYGARSRKSRKGGDDDWLDDQEGLNAVVEKILKKDPSAPKNVKVIETLHRPLDCRALFDCLKASEKVFSLSLVGVQLDEGAASLLSETLREPQTKLKVLQIWRFVPACIPSLCSALGENSELRDIQLTFQGEPTDEQTSMLLRALGKNQGLISIKLFGIDLSRQTNQLESMIRTRKITRELRLTRCRLSSLEGLSLAIVEASTLQIADFSMNELSNDVEVATLLRSKSLNSLTLSKNKFRQGGTELGKVLAQNAVLEELYLDGNNLSEDFAASLLNSLQTNTTIKRLGLVKGEGTDSISGATERSIRYLMALNEAGRGWLCAASAPESPQSTNAVLPHLLHRTKSSPSSLFGVLKEYSNLWIKP